MTTIVRLARLRRDRSGFTLVEVMASLMIFAIVTLGIVPLIASSLRASNRARASTVGKNLVVEAMEFARGLPYFVSVRGQRVDLLDLYYPEYDPDGTYEITCPGGAPAEACGNLRIPDDFTITFRTRFVRIADDGETYETVLADPAYVWDWSSGSVTERLDLPPTQLVEMRITSTWETVLGRRSFTETTLIGARELDRNRTNGLARIDYAMQLATTYDPGTGGPLQDLTATAGSANSTIGTRITSTASQTSDAASAALVERPDVAAGTEAVVLNEIFGAAAAAEAPPDSGLQVQSADDQVVIHPTLSLPLPIAGFSDTDAAVDPGVALGSNLPSAGGRAAVERTNLVGSSPQTFFAENQFGGQDTQRRLRTGDPMVYVPFGVRIASETDAETTSHTTPGRHVLTTASIAIPEIRILPTTFAPRGVVLITNFVASLSCNATASAAADGSVTWSAQLRYWRASLSGYTSPVTLTGNNASPQLVNLTGSANPLVRAASGPNPAVYLFQEGSRIGYLQSWSSLYNVSTVGADERNNGRVAVATLENALSINTVARASTLPQSGLRIFVGNASCKSEDFR